MCIEHARRNRYSVVIEGTMRNPQVPLATAAALRESGCRVQAWVMAVDPLSSRLGILARYHQQRQALGYGRFTVEAAHDAGAAGLLDSVDALQDTRAVDRILIATRGPRVIGDQPGDAPSPRARDVITAERTRTWTGREVTDFTARADRIAADLPLGHAPCSPSWSPPPPAAVRRGPAFRAARAASPLPLLRRPGEPRGPEAPHRALATGGVGPTSGPRPGAPRR